MVPASSTRTGGDVLHTPIQLIQLTREGATSCSARTIGLDLVPKGPDEAGHLLHHGLGAASRQVRHRTQGIELRLRLWKGPVPTAHRCCEVASRVRRS